MDVLGIVNKLSNNIFGSKSDDDFSDRLNYRYTIALLILFSIILTTRQYSSEVIKCWVPAHFTQNYEQYVSQICWIQNTYYFHPNQTLPKSEIERSKNEIKYYQWVSFLLLFQALLFYMPRVFWRTFSIKAGLNITDLIDAAISYKSAEKFEKQKTYMAYLVKNIDQYVDDNRRHDELRPKNRLTRCLGTCFPCFGRYLGNYIIILYIIVKFMYIGINILQVYFISGILGNDFWSFGINFVINVLKGQGWAVSNSRYFPKVTLCDFMIREVGNPNKSHRYTVQCVLPINLFNHQVFTIIWFWYIFVLCWNITGAFVWIQRSISIRANKWITRRVALFNENVKRKLLGKRLDHFLNYYLEPDGIFMIRMIANNINDYVATDLVQNLWCQHHEKYGAMFKDEPHKSKVKCTFDHEVMDHYEYNEIDKFQKQNLSDNYASFGQVYDQNRLRKINNVGSVNSIQQQRPGEYIGIDSNGEVLIIDNEKSNLDETTHFIRKRDNVNQSMNTKPNSSNV